MRWVMHVAGAGHKCTQLRQENINERKKTSNCRRRWKDIKYDLRETGFEDLHWIDLAKDMGK
jgi:hypothetical protein